MTRPPIRITDATEMNLPGLLEIYNAAIRSSLAIWTETEATLEDRRDWLDYRRSSGFPVLAATAGKDVAGYASYGAFRPKSGYARTVEHSVYVADAFQGHGVGRALMNELIGRARAANIAAMVGGVDGGNAASIAFHERLGFEQQGVLKGVGEKFGRRLDLVFMVLDLEAR